MCVTKKWADHIT